jgi:hypothetical protein
MSAPYKGTLTGSAVLLFGILALSSLAGGRTPSDGNGADGSTPAVAPPVVSGAPEAETGRPDIGGVPVPVQRVLFLWGRAEAVQPEQLTDIPPVVAAVLAEYEATLMVPDAFAQGSAPR